MAGQSERERPVPDGQTAEGGNAALFIQKPLDRAVLPEDRRGIGGSSAPFLPFKSLSIAPIGAASAEAQLSLFRSLSSSSVSGRLE